MQVGINRLGKLFTDSRCFGDFFDAGAGQLLQTTEVFEQVTTTLWPYPGYVFQAGSTPGLATPGTVAGNGKTVRFVTDLLDQVQGR
ncbi:hypothetical protein D3C72_2375890 [compost metagenome]